MASANNAAAFQGQSALQLLHAHAVSVTGGYAVVREVLDRTKSALDGQTGQLEGHLAALADQLALASNVGPKPHKIHEDQLADFLFQAADKGDVVATLARAVVAVQFYAAALEGRLGLRAPSPPPGLACAGEVTKTMKGRQKRNPEQWTMTVQQWLEVLDHCKGQALYQSMKKTKGFVNMYDITDVFVKPWTKGTGCGMSVLMSREKGEVAKLMLSHAWGEDLEELRECVQKHLDKHPEISLSTPIWFCCFANYQPEDGEGPYVKEQLEQDPFGKVIKALAGGGFGMLAVHTTRADLYSRLWCVYEVDRARKEKVVVEASMSEKYARESVRRLELFMEQETSIEESLIAAGMQVNTASATCGNQDDERRLVETVMQTAGGFQRLDREISNFRKDVIPREVMLTAVRKDGRALQHGPEKHKADRRLVLEAVKNCGVALDHAARELRADREVVLEAVKWNGFALKYAAKELKADRDFVLEAVQHDPRALSCAAEELKADREVVLEAVKQHGRALEFASYKLKADREVVLEAMRQHGSAVDFAARELQEDCEVKAEYMRWCRRGALRVQNRC